MVAQKGAVKEVLGEIVGGPTGGLWLPPEQCRDVLRRPEGHAKIERVKETQRVVCGRISIATATDVMNAHCHSRLRLSCHRRTSAATIKLRHPDKQYLELHGLRRGLVGQQRRSTAMRLTSKLLPLAYPRADLVLLPVGLTQGKRCQGRRHSERAQTGAEHDGFWPLRDGKDAKTLQVRTKPLIKQGWCEQSSTYPGFSERRADHGASGTSPCERQRAPNHGRSLNKARKGRSQAPILPSRPSGSIEEQNPS